MPGFVEMGEEGAPPDQSPPMRPNSVDPTQVTVESPKTMNVEASASTNSLSAAQNHTVAKFFSTLLTNKVPTAYRQKAGQKACCVLLAMQVAVFTAGLATFGAEVELCTYDARAWMGRMKCSRCNRHGNSHLVPFSVQSRAAPRTCKGNS